MRINHIRRWAAAVGTVSALALIGVGVSSSYTSAVTAHESQLVGTFGCTLSSTDLNAVGNGTNAVTINIPPILSAGSSNYENDLTVLNTGSIPTVVHWTFLTGGTIAWQPTGHMGYAAGTVADPMTTDLTLAGGTSHTYSTVGFMWAGLDNNDLGKTATVTYTANCGEVPPPPPPPASNISFVGAANEAVPTALATTVSLSSNYGWVWNGSSYPPGQAAWGTGTQGAGVLNVASTSAFTGSAPYTVSVVTTLGQSGFGSPANITCAGKTATSFTGCTTTAGGGMLSTGNAVTGPVAPLALPTHNVGDIAIVETWGPNSSSVPTGYLPLRSGYNSEFSYRVLVAGDTTVPNQTTLWAGEMVAVYRGVAGIGASTNNGGFSNNVGGVSYPMQSSALPLTKSDGSSWVASMGYDGYAATNAKTMVFAPFTWANSPPNSPPSTDASHYGSVNTANRSASLADGHTGLADTNAGVSAWGPLEGWSGDNFPLPGSHAVTVASIELLSK